MKNHFISFPAFGGTFTDSGTGLTWDTATYGPMTWQEALNHCENSTAGGYSDWRLPDINELQSLADFEK